MAYLIHIASIFGITLLLAESFNLILGLGALFSLAHVASYALGAYTTALLASELGIGFIPCIALSAASGAFLSLLVAMISLKLDKEYFAIGTLALGLFVHSILVNWKSVTHGVLGIPGIPPPSFGSFLADTPLSLLVVIWCTAVVSLLVLFLVWRSDIGRSLRALGECEPAAESLGRSALGTRTFAVTVGAGVAGIAGGLFAYLLTFIDPSSFTLSEITLLVTIVIIGRPGSFWGCFFAALFMTLLPEALRFISILQSYPGILGPTRQLLYGIILFATIFIWREKLFPQTRRV